jgi:hypothetical protein
MAMLPNSPLKGGDPLRQEWGGYLFIDPIGNTIPLYKTFLPVERSKKNLVI